jgi:RNA polymerase sigma-B factor
MSRGGTDMTVTSTDTLDVHPRDAAAVEQVEEWFRTYHDTHNAAIRERIILAHMGLADRLAGRFRGSRGASYEDLVQSARVGLVSAVNRYDPERPNPFIVYAVVCIVGELKRYLRDASWRVHVARSHKERALQVIQANDALTVTLGRAPTVPEIANRLGVGTDLVLQGLEAIRARSVASLDQPVDDDGGVGVGALIGAPPDEVDVEDLLVLPELLDLLPELERKAVLLRYFDDMHQREIGEVLGCSRTRSPARDAGARPPAWPARRDGSQGSIVGSVATAASQRIGVRHGVPGWEHRCGRCPGRLAT